jgi:hypothetical protein
VKLDFFMLADEVEATEDGKVDIRGGAINRVNVPDLPGTIAGLAVIIRLFVEMEERRREHTINVVFTAPNGETLYETTPGPIPAALFGELAPDDAEVAVVLMGTLGPIEFREAGRHTFVLQVDDDEPVERFLFVGLEPNAEADDESEEPGLEP